MSTTSTTTRTPRVITTRLLTPQQIRAEYGIPETTVRDWVARGHLPTVRVPEARRHWILRTDLDHLIQRSRESTR